MKAFTIVFAALLFALIAAGHASGAGVPFNGSQTPPNAAPSSVLENEQIIEPLAGTLFFSPEQRAKMDRQRRSPKLIFDGLSPVPPLSIVNGFVKRSDEKITVWVDGQMRNDLRSQAAQALKPEDVGGTSTSIEVFDTGRISKLSAQPGKPSSVKKRVTSRKAAKRPAKK